MNEGELNDKITHINQLVVTVSHEWCVSSVSWNVLV